MVAGVGLPGCRRRTNVKKLQRKAVKCVKLIVTGKWLFNESLILSGKNLFVKLILVTNKLRELGFTEED